MDWWTPEKQKLASQVPSPNLFLLGKFIGQGRQLGYFGLVHHFLDSVYDVDGFIRPLDDIAADANAGIEHPWSRPASWWAMSVTALLVVWCEILMAFVISYSSPIVGLSCRSGAYLVYGILGTLSWLISCARKNPGDLTKALCYTANGLSLASLLFIVFAQVTRLLFPLPTACRLTSPAAVGHIEQLRVQVWLRRTHGLGSARLLSQQLRPRAVVGCRRRHGRRAAGCLCGSRLISALFPQEPLESVRGHGADVGRLCG